MIKNLPKEEVANVFTHLPGALFGLGSLMYSQSRDAHWAILVFDACLIFMFTTSSIYHYKQKPDSKRKWRIVDHVSIFFLIWGTYLAYVHIYLQNETGTLIMQILSACVVLGSVLKIFFTGRFRIISTLIYLVMGWVAIFAINDFMEFIPDQILGLIGLGGVLYTLGTVFYLWKKLPYNHAIWHLMVLAGALSHWYGVYLSL
jgi:hemolysin III